VQPGVFGGHAGCALPTFGAAASKRSAAIIGKMTPLALRAEKFRPFFRIAIKQRVVEFVLCAGRNDCATSELRFFGLLPMIVFV
jgi:hypothetical protein